LAREPEGWTALYQQSSRHASKAAMEEQQNAGLSPSMECHVKPPRVSIIMAVNRIDGYLQAAIDSILNQTFSNFELLVIADSGCPGLSEQVLQCAGGDRRIRIVTARIGGGVAFSRNLGIVEARGEYVAVMDGDDVSRPDRLRRQAEFLDRNPDIDVVGCRVQMIDQTSKNLARGFRYFETDAQIRKVLPYRVPIPHPAVMFRKRALIRLQGYKYGHSGEDYEMFIRMARDRTIRFYNLNEVLLEYRRHGVQLTHASQLQQQYAEISGFLFTEFLLTHSPKYLLGMLILHPWVRRTRLAWRKLSQGREL
jgi:glycosyltransferase involved in cell wall biosynthesis